VVGPLKWRMAAINSGCPLKIGAITTRYVLPTLPLFPQKNEPPSFFFLKIPAKKKTEQLFWLARDSPWVSHGLGGLNVHAHFLTNNLNGPPNKMLGLN
jgi:hypothetical protein